MIPRTGEEWLDCTRRLLTDYTGRRIAFREEDGEPFATVDADEDVSALLDRWRDDRDPEYLGHSSMPFRLRTFLIDKRVLPAESAFLRHHEPDGGHAYTEATYTRALETFLGHCRRKGRLPRKDGRCEVRFNVHRYDRNGDVVFVEKKDKINMGRRLREGRLTDGEIRVLVGFGLDGRFAPAGSPLHDRARWIRNSRLHEPNPHLPETFLPDPSRPDTFVPRGLPPHLAPSLPPPDELAPDYRPQAPPPGELPPSEELPAYSPPFPGSVPSTTPPPDRVTAAHLRATETRRPLAQESDSGSTTGTPSPTRPTFPTTVGPRTARR
ncbi:hypothetical protein ABT336_26215 [Micromonospora sp. NPDC000207]|uniref:hypothetical protein n=1 Tax=Micromonospora sp. NPDC000207 TaxID=3154246 RepID=UPI00332A9FA9